ncbi:hypothetical protein [Aeromonas bestiarum]|uniref:hypothetical protein n=1 Tax=Aeromonas bestiarum TaxID=105751 RepID=UPI0032B1381B
MMTEIDRIREALQCVDAKSEKAQGKTLPEITLNLSSMSLAELNNLIISAARAAAPKWRGAGVKLNTYPLPHLEIVDDVASALYLNLPAGDPAKCECGKYPCNPARRIACRVDIELPDLDHINRILEDERSKEVGEHELAKMRAMFKKGGGNEVV